jgi:hypothetical protein
MMRTPDAHGRLELSRFLTPPAVADHRTVLMNAQGYLRMFAVDGIDQRLERRRKRGAQLVGEVVEYRDAYRLCYFRGPEGLLIGLAHLTKEQARAEVQELWKLCMVSDRTRRLTSSAIQHVAALGRRIARDRKDGTTQCDGATMFFMGATVFWNEPGRFLRDWDVPNRRWLERMPTTC